MSAKKRKLIPDKTECGWVYPWLQGRLRSDVFGSDTPQRPPLRMHLGATFSLRLFFASRPAMCGVISLGRLHGSALIPGRRPGRPLFRSDIASPARPFGQMNIRGGDNKPTSHIRSASDGRSMRPLQIVFFCGNPCPWLQRVRAEERVGWGLCVDRYDYGYRWP